VEPEHEISLLADPHLWVNLGFLIFAAIAGPKIWKALSAVLDQRSMRIKAQLDEAQKLRDEAQALLNEYQRKQQQGMKEAEEIVTAAKSLAASQSAESLANLEASMGRREKLAMEKIAQAEAQAMAEVRREAVDVASAATAKLLAQVMDENRANALVDQSIEELDRKLH
jgi:F-type H+-transporting ATPase subunit b